MKRIEPWKALTFVGVLGAVAATINWTRNNTRSEQTQRSRGDTTAEHVRSLVQYVNEGMTRETGKPAIVVAAISETGMFDATITSALTSKCKSTEATVFPKYFTPEFVSSGLFNALFDGSRNILPQLHLTNSLDNLLLGRISISYLTNATLNDVITASMTLEVTAISVANREPNKKWTLTAAGAGFKKDDARLMAEQRLVNQIAEDSRIAPSFKF